MFFDSAVTADPDQAIAGIIAGSVLLLTATFSRLFREALALSLGGLIIILLITGGPEKIQLFITNLLGAAHRFPSFATGLLIGNTATAVLQRLLAR